MSRRVFVALSTAATAGLVALPTIAASITIGSITIG